MNDYEKTQKQFSEQIRTHRVVAILRHMPPEQAEMIFSTLAEAGVRLVEITMNSPGAARQIQSMRNAFQDQLSIGAGTVTSVERADMALQAGADFLVTPNLNLDVVELAKAHNVPVLPGVMTPTEMMTAAAAGVKVLKLFPASFVGYDFVKAVKAPLDDLEFVAVGGVSAANAAKWIQAGCIGVGMGSSLLDFDQLREGKRDKVVGDMQTLLSELKK